MDKSILVVDDDDVLREQLLRAFARRGYATFAANSADTAVETISEHLCDFAVIDLRMPGRSGMTLLPQIRAISPHTKCVIVTGFGSISSTVEALRNGAVNYLPKPAHADQIIAAFDELDDSLSAIGEVDSDPTPSLAQAEWEHIQRVLAECGGNISQAAFRLDISRRSLQRILRKRAP
jgi:two-component system response regulator RegA